MNECKACGAAQEPGTTTCSQCGAQLEPQTSADASASSLVDEVAATPISLEKIEASEPQAAEAPETSEPTVDNTPPSPPAPKKMPFSIKRIVAVTAGLTILAIILALLIPQKNSQASTPIFQAFDKTAAAVSAEFSQASKDIGLATVLHELESKGVTQEISMTFPIDATMNMDFHMLQTQNAAMDQVYGLVDAKVSGLSLSLLEYSMDKDFLAVASPFFFSGIYGLPLDDLQSLPESDLGQLVGIPEEYMESLTGYINVALQKTAEQPILSESTIDALKEAGRQLEQATTCSAPVETSISVNDSELLCQRYVADISPDTLQTYLLSCMNALLEDELVSSYLQLTVSSGQMYYGDSLESIKADMEAEIAELCKNLKSITLTAYLQDSIALRTEFLLSNQDNENAQVILELGGDGTLTNAFSLSVQVEGASGLQITHRGTIIPVDGIVESRINMSSFSSDWDDTVVLDFWWDTRISEDNFHLYGGAEYNAASMEITGNVSLDGGILLSPMEIYFNDGYGTETTMPMSLTYTEAGTIKNLSEHAKNILDMSTQELMALMQEIDASVSRWLGESLYGL